MATKDKVQEMEQEQAKVEDQIQAAAGEADGFPDELPTDLEGMENTGLMVSRRQIPSTKKKWQMIWVYSVLGVLRGRKVQVSLQASDIGGYSLLDLVFNGENVLALWRKAFSNKNDKGVVTSSGWHYFAISIDEVTGIPYIAPLKPSAKSDKFLLESLIKNESLLAEQRKAGDGSGQS